MKKFEHFILTAFCVDIGAKKSGYDREKLLGEDYLLRRLDLFQKFCFPSLYHQSNQNFKWLIFFDEETPTSIKEKIEELSAWKNLIPVYTRLS